MAHEVEKMAYVGETPWHGLGTKLDANESLDKWTEAAGLNWNAEVSPMFRMTNGEFHEVPNNIVVHRSDNGNTLGVFKDRYKVVQPSQILNFFNNYVLADERFTMESAGSLKGGAIIWALAKFQDDTKIVGEDHAQYVHLCTSFDGTRATTAQATLIRVVCKNTLTASIYSKNAATIRVSHSSHFDDVRQDIAARELAMVASTFDDYKALAEGLNKVKMSKKDTEALITKVLSGYDDRNELSTRIQHQIDDMLNSVNMTIEEGTPKGTAWTILNATTRYVDHMRSTRKTNGENEVSSRMQSSFFGSGHQLKQKMLKTLLEV